MDDLLELLEGAQRYDDSIWSLCPFHDDSRPSFVVYPDRYYCKSCGATGRTQDLVNKLQKIPVRGIFKQEKTHFRNPFRGWIKRYSRLGLSLKAAHQNLPSEYLSRRGVTEDFQRELRLGYLDDWYTFPIYNSNGKIVGAVARRGENNKCSAKYVVPPKQDPNLLYIPSWKRLNGHRAIYLTYGILDAISLHIMGLASVSTLSGTTLNPKALDFLRKHIYIMPDKKEEPQAHKLASKLGWRGHVISCNWIGDTKDVNDLFIYNKTELERVINANT